MMSKFGEAFKANTEFNYAFALKVSSYLDIIYGNYVQFS